jgi:hypothetical protein
MEGSGRGLIEVLSGHFPGETEEKPQTGFPVSQR